MFRSFFCWIAVASGALAQSAPKNILPCAFVDLVVVFDRSGSMQNPQKNELAKQGMVDFATNYALSRKDALQIGVGIFTAVPRILSDLTDDRNELAAAMKRFPVPSKSTSITAGLSVAQSIFMNQLLDPMQAHRMSAKKVLVFFSDGESDAEDFSTARSIAWDLASGAWSTDEGERPIPVTIHVVQTISGGEESGGMDESMYSLVSEDGSYLLGSYAQVYEYLQRFNICG